MTNKRKTNEQYDNELFEKEINAIRIGDYAGSTTSILHACVEGHQYMATPNNTLRGKHKCPECVKTPSRDVNRPAILYFVSFLDRDETKYKIGVTHNTAKHRYGEEWVLRSMQLLWEVKYETIFLAKANEQMLLHKNRHLIVSTKALSTGNTEVLSCPISAP